MPKRDLRVQSVTGINIDKCKKEKLIRLDSSQLRCKTRFRQGGLNVTVVFYSDAHWIVQ